MGRPLNLHRYGGPTTAAGKQIVVRSRITTNARSASLIQQKNQYSFRVEDSASEVGICKLVDKISANLLPGEMSLTVTPTVGSPFRVRKITNRFVWDFTGVRFLWTLNATTGKVEAENA